MCCSVLGPPWQWNQGWPCLVFWRRRVQVVQEQQHRWASPPLQVICRDRLPRLEQRSDFLTSRQNVAWDVCMELPENLFKRLIELMP